MKRFFVAALLWLLAVPAFGQWQVPSGCLTVGRGAGVTGYLNGCSNLGAIESLQINPTSGTADRGLFVNQPGSTVATTLGANLYYNYISVSNDQAVGNTGSAFYTYGLEVDFIFGGSQPRGSKYAIRGITNGAGSGGATSTGGDIVGIAGWAVHNASNGGSAGVYVGTLYGAELIGKAFSGATNYLVVSSAEVTAQLNSGASSKHRWGISFISNGGTRGGFLVDGTTPISGGSDAAIQIGAVAGTVSWINGIILSNVNGLKPIDTTGCIICTDGSANTITSGIDLSAYTITGYLIRGGYAYVDGSGNVIGATGNFGKVSGSANALTLVGTTSGSVNFAVQATHSNTITVPTGAGGTLAINASSPLSLSLTTGLLTLPLTNTHIFVGNSSNVATDVAAGGDLTLANTGAFTIANNAVTLAKLATQATNTVLGNATSGTAVPTALAVGTCSTASSALIWTTNTGFGCNTSITAAVATQITATATSTNASFFPTFVASSSTGSQGIAMDADLTYNPSTNIFTVPTLTATSLLVTGMTNAATTSAVCYNTGTGLLTYDGTIGTCTISDERKKNMGPRIDHALDKLLKINGVYYTWKDQTMGAGRQIGVGAQTVEKVFPELVQTDSTGTKSADYQRLAAPIIEAIRELDAKVKRLERRQKWRAH